MRARLWLVALSVVALLGSLATATVPVAAPGTVGQASAMRRAKPHDPQALKPGTNHNWKASAYVYEAKDVQACLVAHQPNIPVYGTCPDKKIAFLTFDDGPSNSITPKVLDILAKEKVPATFFYITGRLGLASADHAIVHRTIAEGHSITLHTHSHRYKELYPRRHGNADAIMADRATALAEVRKVLGPQYSVSGYRYPGGHESWKNLGEADRRLVAENAYWLDWNTMNGDSDRAAPRTAQGQVDMMNRMLRARGNPKVAVVLMHDHRESGLTVKALPMIIKSLRSQGYEFGVIN